MLALSLLLSGGVCNSELCAPGGCSALLSGSSSAPMAPPSNVDQAYSGDGDYSRLDAYPLDSYEIHGVTGFSQCQKMATRFRNEGRKVQLRRAMPNPSKGVLKYLCIFDGEDVNNDIFMDTRYNSPQEYQSP